LISTVPTWAWPLALAFSVAGCTEDNSRHFTSSVVDVGGGRRMYIECEGVGSPTVVLVSGKGNRADTWSTNIVDPGKPQATVFHEIGSFTRVCAYDRPRTVGVHGEPSRSDAVPEPLRAKDGSDDLHALLAAAYVPGPYVIVAHSYGGLVARLYASTHPEAVAGLVLEDALSEGLVDRLDPQQRAVFERLNLDPERIDNDSSFAQVTTAPAVRPVPMIVLTADLPPIGAEDIARGLFPPDVTVEFADALWAAQVAAQDQLAGLFSFARHVTKTNSHHYIHYEQPRIVIDAIRDVVGQVRNR
jgi:pimeloyl-ACP methyl ester carboxylesterase